MKCRRCWAVIEVDARQDRTWTKQDLTRCGAPCESLYAIVVTANCICAVDITSRQQFKSWMDPTWPALPVVCAQFHPLGDRGLEVRIATVHISDLLKAHHEIIFGFNF